VHAPYLYYVGRADGTGPLYFSNTYAQFLKDRTRSGI
jgi:cell division protein YceG involved in septum cleavage